MSRPPSVPLVCNRTGAIAAAEDELPGLLAEQLTHPIHWAESMGTLARLGVTDYVIPGPAKVLRALLRANLGRDVRVHAVERPGQLERAREALNR